MQKIALTSFRHRAPARFTLMLILGISAALASQGSASANPERDRCGRDISSGPLLTMCPEVVAGASTPFASTRTDTAGAAVPVTAKEGCGLRSPGLCPPENDRR